MPLPKAIYDQLSGLLKAVEADINKAMSDATYYILGVKQAAKMVMDPTITRELLSWVTQYDIRDDLTEVIMHRLAEAETDLEKLKPA